MGKDRIHRRLKGHGAWQVSENANAGMAPAMAARRSNAAFEPIGTEGGFLHRVAGGEQASSAPTCARLAAVSAPNGAYMRSIHHAAVMTLAGWR